MDQDLLQEWLECLLEVQTLEECKDLNNNRIPSTTWVLEMDRMDLLL